MKLIKNAHKSRRTLGAAALMVGALAFGVMCQPASADNIHFVCLDGSPACGSAATVTDTTNPPSFGLEYKGNGGAPTSGDLILVFLVPEANGMLTAPITISGSASQSATLYSTTPWTTGQLDAYLHIPGGANPANPIGNYGASYVYEADLGNQTICQEGGTCTDPFDLTSSALPTDTYILGFLGISSTTPAHGNHPAITSTTWYGTPNSEVVLDTGTPNVIPSTPEPSSLALLGTGVLGLAGMVRRKFRS